MRRYTPDPDPPGSVERAVLFVIAITAAIVVGVFVALLIAIAFLFSAKPSHAQMQVPQACIELAASFGRAIPPVLGRFAYERAKAELKQLSDADPAVKACRDALAKIERKK